eukprot:131399_1
MADEKVRESLDEKQSKGSNVADLGDFLSGKGLLKYKDVLVEAGLEDIEMVNDLDDEDITYYIKEAKLKKMHGKIFQKAVKQFQAGTYNPAVADPFKTLREK